MKQNIINAVTLAITGAVSYYLAQWILPSGLAAVKDAISLIATAGGGALGVVIGNAIGNLLPANTPTV